MFLSCAHAARNFVQWTVISHCCLTVISERVETLAPHVHFAESGRMRERTPNVVVIRLSKVPPALLNKDVQKFSLKKPYRILYTYILMSFRCFQYLLLYVICSRLIHIRCINIFAIKCNIADELHRRTILNLFNAKC